MQAILDDRLMEAPLHRQFPCALTNSCAYADSYCPVHMCAYFIWGEGLGKGIRGP